MTTHPLLPGVTLALGLDHPAYRQYLSEWREEAASEADNGVTAASICLQAAWIDLVLEGKLCHDWLSVMEDLLADANRPIAYSLEYSKRLHKFEAQYLQSTVHAIHARWWIGTLTKPGSVDHGLFGGMILAKKSPDGLIYDGDISKTILRHRMKAELSMSALMGAQIDRKSVV